METEPMCCPICLQSHMLSHHKHVMQYSHVAGIMPGGGVSTKMIKIIAQIACFLFLFNFASLLHVSRSVERRVGKEAPKKPRSQLAL